MTKMNIDGDNYFINKRKQFSVDAIEFKSETVKKVFQFAYDMSFGKGEHRDHRSGGTYARRKGEIFINAFQGKLAELAVYNQIFIFDKLIYKQLSPPDFDVYGLGEWDDADIEFKGMKLSIKSTKSFGNLLLLETKDWSEKGEYIPNIGKDNKIAIYDFFVLVRISPSGEDIMKKSKLLYSDQIQLNLLEKIICEEKWKYDIPGYIAHENLVDAITQKHIMPKSSYLNGKTKMDAENYYIQSGDMIELDLLLSEWKDAKGQ